MINLSRLSVSLTKHGAHKIAWLIRDYDPDTILNRLSGSVAGINIEEAQARKNLSVGTDNKVPQVWKDAKSKGTEVINGLVLIAIIFSHHDLIAAMKKGAIAKFAGRITRGDVLDGKAYTNFAHTIEELGYSTRHTSDEVDFDLSRLFKIPGLNTEALKIFGLKMRAAGWDGKVDVKEILIQNDFHKVFATDKSQFESWLSTGDIDEALESLEDSDYFLGSDVPSVSGEYKFKAGHRSKKTGSVNVKTPVTSKTAKLIHNYIQNNMHKQLVEKYGPEQVGCEVPTGLGTSIDVVVETKKFRWFYEIKVAKTIKACIRQAIPQLLEYAYWSEKDLNVEKLFIVSQFPLDDDAKVYLEKLRDKFGLPLHYEQFVDL
ncbi:hypothetical protein KDX16_21025 [Burkholderia vietnamiensis]|uniref:hypothetical protein n=1 Tax=Burkholderia vietnamiensis TaxID=60552 RepID=UPI001B9CC7AA|nr:hypothetical protein [Burkholderia vietnamiensis]MBR7918272.1 hypothetical protein [Burkholderia vietnamiensis]